MQATNEVMKRYKRSVISTMTLTTLDEDLVILENLDFDLTCESHLGCSKTATWSLLRACCDNVVVFCDVHHNDCINWLKTWGSCTFTCHACNTTTLKYDDFTWVKL